MGFFLSKFKSKESNKEQLERIDDEIRYLEDYQFSVANRQKNLIGLLFLITIFIWLTYLVLLYFYWPIKSNWHQGILYFSPMLIFSLCMYLLKRGLECYYHRSIRDNEDKLRNRRRERRKILDRVKETETYKVAKELLEKYDPSMLKDSSSDLSITSSLRYRGSLSHSFRSNSSFNTSNIGSPEIARTINAQRPSITTYSMPVQSFMSQAPSQRLPQMTPLPTPRLFRPIVSQDRSVVEKLVDYVVGDGPSNRYALICIACNSHNGMALKDEFEFLAFRCCYCFTFNPARKQRPFAPAIMPAPEAPAEEFISTPTIVEAESDADDNRSEIEIKSITCERDTLEKDDKTVGRNPEDHEDEEKKTCGSRTTLQDNVQEAENETKVEKNEEVEALDWTPIDVDESDVKSVLF